MRKVGLFEAKQKLSELVERAVNGERIGITRRGELAVYIVPARPGVDVREVFTSIDRIRRRSKKPRHVSVKSLIEEGRT